MKCLLCGLNCSTEKVIKKHVNFHQIKEDDIFFKDLFLPDTLEKKCNFCDIFFKTCRQKKIHMFFFHYGTKKQFGGSKRSTLPINILKRGSITYFSINFTQHKNFYDFFKSDVVDDFLQSVYESYHPQKNKIKGFFEIINKQRGEAILEDNRAWLTNLFITKHFNTFIRTEIKNKIIKRIIVNGQSGSSWFFKRFERLSIITTPANQVQLFSN